MNEALTVTSPAPSSSRAWRVGSLTYTRSDLSTVIFWLLLGAFAWMFKDRCNPSIAQLLLSDFGASDNLTGILIGSLPYAMALFVLPVVGYYSDRHRGPEGRRIPYLTRIIPIIAIAMPGLTLSPWLGYVLDRSLGSFSPGLDTSVIIFLSLFWGLLQFADIIGNLLISALANDVVPQRVIGRFFGGYRAVGLLAGVVFNFYLFDGSDSVSVVIFSAFSILTVLGLCLMCMKIREGDYAPLPETAKGLAMPQQYIRECFGSSYYWLAYIAITFSMAAYGPVNLYSTLFSREIMTADTYGKLLALTFTISFVLAYPIGMLADRFHPLRVGMVTMALYAAVTLWGGLCALTPTSFNVAFVLHGVVAGSCMTATASLAQRLLPRMKFAQFASAAGILTCIVNILIGPVSGYILGATHPVYRYLFLMNSAMAGIGLISLFLLYRAFLARGGEENHDG